MVQAHLIHFLPRPWIQPFLQGALLPFSKECYVEVRIQAVGMPVAIGMLLHSGPFSGKSREFVHVHTGSITTVHTNNCKPPFAPPYIYARVSIPLYFSHFSLLSLHLSDGIHAQRHLQPSSPTPQGSPKFFSRPYS